MDANGTRFHLVFGKGDWLPSGASPAQSVEWNDDDATLTLRREAFVFPSIPGATRRGASDRRGAGRDRYGNYYWIADDRAEILFLGKEERQPEHFWSSTDELAACSPTGAFIPIAPRERRRLVLGGLAVTEDHYLVVGLVEPKGLLVFDLHAGGPPLESHWPADVAFVPFDIAPTAGGGVWILDRENRCYWGLDRLFRVMRPASAPPASPPQATFQPVGQPPVARPQGPLDDAISAGMAMSLEAREPIGIEAVPDGTVLILDSPPSSGHSVLYRYRLAQRLGNPISFDALDTGVPYALLGQDVAMRGGDTVFVADSVGNQVFAFDFAADTGALRLQPQFFPVREFGGRAVVSDGASISYDFEDRWALLAPQPRLRFVPDATWTLPQRDDAFDGREPGCVWHRLLLDACIPPGAEVVVESRAADRVDVLDAVPWQREPDPYLRRNGSELPSDGPLAVGLGARQGTWELLFQNAVGRHLQLRLTLRGTGRSSPRLHALRIYYPRFSYVREYLPAVYREDATSASFLERFLANPEGILTEMEGRAEQVQTLFDPSAVPPAYLDWLAGWLGIAFDLAWSEPVRRFFLANAMRFFAARGTPDGVTRAIRLTLDQCSDASLFDPTSRTHFGVRLVEHYLTRKAPGVVFGDPNDLLGPGSTTDVLEWTPAQGPGPLDQRQRDYLRDRYLDVAALNAAWGTAFAGFDDADLRLPAVQPTQAAQAADWLQFIRGALGFTYAPVSRADQAAYQDFLARRYRQPRDLNEAYGLTGNAALANFADVSAKLWDPILTATLPTGVMLQDWIVFVSVVLLTIRNAHRFTIVVPVQIDDDVDTQIRRREVARRVAEQEKPAHTQFDVKLYWAIFRAGEARVGLETVLGPSSRFVALIVGRGVVAASYLEFVEPWNVRGRVVVGRDQLNRRADARREGTAT